jgi:hypothetical protein
MATNRMTPVAAAKELGIRPQIVYGYIKHGRLATFPNTDGGKAAFVDLDIVRTLVGSTVHHREKDPSTGKPVKREASGINVGTILSGHGYPKGAKKHYAHRVNVVDEIIKGEDATLIYTRRGEDGTVGVIYETERLADAIAKGKCHIESPEALLGVLMFHFVHTERADVAASLDAWAFNHDLIPINMEEKTEELTTIITTTTESEPEESEQLAGEE